MTLDFNRKEHWEKVYASKSHREVSWFTDHVNDSLEIIKQLIPIRSTSMIDVGGGASTLVDDLLENGYSDITVLDISAKALSISQERMGSKANSVKWIVGDLLSLDLPLKSYALWHDRAVFHFLTNESERVAYRHQIEKHLASGGFAIFSIFAEDGPEKCSGIFVKRNSHQELIEWMGTDFEVVHQSHSIHQTPSGTEQRFQQKVFRKK